jgi:hypothetical protein
VSINVVRLVVAGVVAGVIRLIGGGISRAVVLDPLFGEALRRNHPTLIPSMETTVSKVGMTVFNVLIGVTMVYFYAALRPRFASRTPAVLRAAILVWLVASLNWCVTALMGLFSWEHVVVESLVTLGPVLVAAFAGASIYAEGDGLHSGTMSRLASAETVR